MTTPTNADRFKACLLYVGGTSAGWVLFTYAGLGLQNAKGEMHVWADVFRLVATHALNGVVLGAISGILTVVALRPWLQCIRPMLWTTILAYVAGLPLGLLLAVLLIWRSAAGWNSALLTAASSDFLIYPAALSMIFTGAVIALVQWSLFFRRWRRLRVTETALWVFGNALIWAVGFIAANTAWAFAAPALVRQAVAGGVIGLLTVALLFFLLDTSAARAIRTS